MQSAKPGPANFPFTAMENLQSAAWVATFLCPSFCLLYGERDGRAKLPPASSS